MCNRMLGGTVALLAAVMATPDVRAASPAYSIQDLGTLDTGLVSDGAGVNALDHVAGQSRTSPTSLFHAFVWRDGGLTDLGTLRTRWSATPTSSIPSRRSIMPSCGRTA